ncbi:MAG: hypothetical protein CVU06_09605, partial [Bacteroidetes bacterium HGW-Bacteroidetes-22]
MIPYSNRKINYSQIQYIMKFFTRFTAMVVVILAFGTGVRGASAVVALRPTHIDISATTSESAVLMTLSAYTSDDARYRLYNSSVQYNCWDAVTGAYITSSSYGSGPQVIGTPTTTTTFWILFQRGANINTAASYRDRLGSAYSTNYQTVALPAATSITTPFTVSGTFAGTGSYTTTVRYVALAFSGSTLVSAASTNISTGTFAVVCPDGTTIDKIEIRTVDNTIVTSKTGSWTTTTDIGTFPTGSNPAVALNVTQVNNGQSPVAGVPFSVIVQSVDASNNVANVSSDVNITLTSTGTIGGTTTGTILSGSNNVTISGVTLTEGAALTITASDNATTLTSGTSTAFNVVVENAAFRSKASGNWNAASTWEIQISGSWFDASFIPTSGLNDVTILPSHIVALTDNTGKCADLTVQTTGKLWKGSTSNSFLYIYGNITCDGVIGSEDNGITPDGISFDIEGSSCTISGNGIFDAGRLSKYTETNTTLNMYINMDFALRYSHATNAALYNFNSTTTTFNIILGAGKKLSVPNAKIDLTGCTFTLQNGASLLDNGVIDGMDGTNTVVNKTINNSNYHLLFLPVNNTFTASPTFDGFYLDEYAESNGAWTPLVDASSVTPFKGYSLKYDNGAGALSFTGTLFTGDQNFNALSYTAAATGYLYGWNLIGNPFCSAIDLDLGGFTNANLNGFVYVWNGANYVSGPLAGGAGTLTDNIIPAHQGFFVRTSDAGATLTIPQAARVQSSQAYYKEAKTYEDVIGLTVTGNNAEDRMLIALNADATAGYDSRYDAFKLFGNTDAPQLYTVVGDQNISVNSVNAIDVNTEFALMLKVGVNRQYTIAAEHLATFMNGADVYLTDLQTNYRQNLSQNPVYTFTANTGDASNRFKVSFAAVGVDENPLQNVGIYAANGMVYIKTAESTQARVTMTNLAGQIVEQRSAYISGELVIPAPATTGMYMVTMTTGQG